MKHHAIPFSLLLSLAISGCLADMEEFEAYMLPCEEGKTICSDDGKQLLKCVNHELVFAQFCPTQCSEGACDCEEGETICSEDRKELLLCLGNKLEFYKSCPYLCSNGACNTIPEEPEAPEPTPKCTDEETTCAGNKIYRCQSGKWEHVATCENACENGACIDKPGDDPCTKCKDGQTCDPETGICIDSPPTNCSDNETRCSGNEIYRCQNNRWIIQESCPNSCKNGSCVDIDPCANKTCPDSYRCDREKGGTCVEIDPCEGISCPASQTCIKARCIDNACIINGSEKNCGNGKTCVKGDCIDDGCQGKSCDAGWQCIKGICEETACLEMFCEEGRSCKGGRCVDNECLSMTCSNNMICSKGNCTYEACLDKDPCTTGKTCNAKGNCEFITPPAITLDTPNDKTTDESGKSISLMLHLNNQPTAEVRIACIVITDSQNKEVNINCDDIAFNAYNWQNAQTILITGVDEYVKDGDQTYKIKIRTISTDPDFNGLVTQSVELTNIDKTKPGFIISETFLTTYEDQSQPPATFTIQLASMPSADVSLALASSNSQEGIVSPEFLRFTINDWNKPQTVTIKGVDDEIRDGNKNYTVFFTPSESNDEDYSGLQAYPIKVTNVDNDVAGLNINIPAEDFEIQEGEQRSVVIKTNTQPKRDVNIAVTVNNNEAVLSDSKVTLNAYNWNTGKEIYLTGVSDDIIDGDQPFKMTFTATSVDEDYNLEPVVFNGIVKDKVNANLIVAMGDAPIVKEGSSDFVTMSLTLSSKPTKNVSVALSVTDDTELKINKTTLTFTSEHWDVPLDILVNSVDDEIVDGNIKSKVVMKMTSSDKNFNGKTQEIEYTTIDDDKAGFVIESSAASFPENSSSTTSMMVSLQSQPTADVKVTVSSTDASEVKVLVPTTLTFTKANWNKPQDVTIRVVDDNIADGTQTAQIKFVGASTDSNFNGITGLSAVYAIIDDEAPAIALLPKDMTVTLLSPSTKVAVSLGAPPTSDVKVTLTSNHNAISFSPSQLTFTTSNWSQPQLVTLNVNFNAIETASTTVTISAKATASNSYNNIVSNQVVINTLKVPEVQNFAYTGGIQHVSLPKGTYKLEVWGAEGGAYQAVYPGGKGGYAMGTLNVQSTTTVYIVVGGTAYSTTGGYNGGGAAVSGRGGGGATHIATTSGLLKTLSGNKSSVLIVGGAGGGAAGTVGYAGAGGGLTGGDGYNSHTSTYAKGGTQSAGGAGEAGQSATGSSGLFGAGGNGSAGGGAGWYGGGGAASNSGASTEGGGGGGSSYTSGNLANTQTIPGSGNLPAPQGGFETGHFGPGYARITLLK